MCESADVLVTKQPSDLRNRQRFVDQMTLSKIGYEPLQDAGERQPLRRQTPCKRSLAYT
jgi:hypothetical protein